MSTPSRTSEGDTPRLFTLADFLRQIEMLAQPGMMRDLIGRMPGMSEIVPAGENPVVVVKRVRGMINSMTKKEQADPDMIDTPRRQRIAAGAGVQPHEVNRFLKQFDTVRAQMKRMAGMSLFQRMKLMAGLSMPAE